VFTVDFGDELVSGEVPELDAAFLIADDQTIPLLAHCQARNAGQKSVAFLEYEGRQKHFDGSCK
jgi:hypothetical protein